MIHDALGATLVAMGQSPWTLEETKTRVRASLRDSFPALFGDRWQEAERVFSDAYAATHLSRLTPMPGAGPTWYWGGARACGATAARSTFSSMPHGRHRR